MRNKTVCEDLLAKVEKDLDTKVDKVTFETSLRKFSEY